MFTFLDYNFDDLSNVASFRYQGKDGIVFTETVKFTRTIDNYDRELLNNALFLGHIILGTSYYKAEPTTEVKLPRDIDKTQTLFFNKIYQEGLSQFAFENQLTRERLAVSESNKEEAPTAKSLNQTAKALVLVSGGKDSLLALEKIKQSGISHEIAYISPNGTYPSILNDLGNPIIIERTVDKENLKNAGGMNGHVPVTLINEAISLIQAILIGAVHIEFGIGKEGLEPHAWIGDLPVNHQWSKTEEAQGLLKNYIKTYIANNLTISSTLENHTELEIAEEFAKTCWDKYAGRFSSCNVANYKQDNAVQELKWCGKCAKCANSYLLFCPYVPYEKQLAIFGHDLFTDPELKETFKGLLGVDGVMKPFECIASIDELKWAYEHKLPGYGDINF